MKVVPKYLIICFCSLFCFASFAHASPSFMHGGEGSGHGGASSPHGGASSAHGGASSANAEKSKKVTSFTIECDKAVESGFYGVNRMVLSVGEEVSCTMLLDHKAIGLEDSAGNKLSSNLQTSPSETVVIVPEHGQTDGNGRFRFTITARKKGSEYISWAVADKSGQFNFSKEALKQGLAYGMFVKIEK